MADGTTTLADGNKITSVGIAAGAGGAVSVSGGIVEGTAGDGPAGAGTVKGTDDADPASIGVGEGAGGAGPAVAASDGVGEAALRLTAAINSSGLARLVFHLINVRPQDSLCFQPLTLASRFFPSLAPLRQEFADGLSFVLGGAFPQLTTSLKSHPISHASAQSEHQSFALSVRTTDLHYR